ncbi:MAG: response regulator [Candidatus Longimicrobiales bacterium M2_2A_002]
MLVVEDQPGVRSMVCRSLERAGYRVLEAEDGVEALEVCEREPGIDLVLTDMVMPEMGGRDLAKQVRARYPGIQVLYMSGHPDPDGAQPLALDDDAELLEKPFGPGELQRKVGDVLATSRRGGSPG